MATPVDYKAPSLVRLQEQTPAMGAHGVTLDPKGHNNADKVGYFPIANKLYLPAVKWAPLTAEKYDGWKQTGAKVANVAFHVVAGSVLTAAYIMALAIDAALSLGISAYNGFKYYVSNDNRDIAKQALKYLHNGTDSTTAQAEIEKAQKLIGEKVTIKAEAAVAQIDLTKNVQEQITSAIDGFVNHHAVAAVLKDNETPRTALQAIFTQAMFSSLVKKAAQERAQEIMNNEKPSQSEFDTFAAAVAKGFNLNSINNDGTSDRDVRIAAQIVKQMVGREIGIILKDAKVTEAKTEDVKAALAKSITSDLGKCRAEIANGSEKLAKINKELSALEDNAASMPNGDDFAAYIGTLIDAGLNAEISTMAPGPNPFAMSIAGVDQREALQKVLNQATRLRIEKAEVLATLKTSYDRLMEVKSAEFKLDDAVVARKASIDTMITNFRKVAEKTQAEVAAYQSGMNVQFTNERTVGLERHEGKFVVAELMNRVAENKTFGSYMRQQLDRLVHEGNADARNARNIMDGIAYENLSVTADSVHAYQDGNAVGHQVLKQYFNIDGARVRQAEDKDGQPQYYTEAPIKATEFATAVQGNEALKALITA